MCRVDGWSSQYSESDQYRDCYDSSPTPFPHAKKEVHKATSFVIMNASSDVSIAIATPTKFGEGLVDYELKKMGGTTVNLITILALTIPRLCAHQGQRSRTKVKFSIFSGWKSAKRYAKRTITSSTEMRCRCDS